MDDPTALDWATLAIALVGMLTGVAALVTQVWVHLLSGPRVKVRATTAISMPDGRVRLALDVRNVGRLPVTVEDVGVMFRAEDEWKTSSVRMWPAGSWWGASTLPHRLDDGAAASWLAEPGPMASTLSDVGARKVRAYARLGNGKMVKSRKQVDAVHMASLNSRRR